jgi:hypothetical protein
MRSELAAKEIILLQKEAQLLEKEQTLIVLKEEVGLFGGGGVSEQPGLSRLLLCGCLGWMAGPSKRRVAFSQRVNANAAGAGAEAAGAADKGQGEGGLGMRLDRRFRAAAICC